jgi:hypothetical protein
MTKQELITKWYFGKEGKNHNAESIIDGEVRRFRLYDTDIAVLQNGMLHLANGGWETMTTKSYINMILDILSLPLGLIQRKGEWILQTYKNGLVVNEKLFNSGLKINLNNY